MITKDDIADIIAKRGKRISLIQGGFSPTDADEISRAESLPAYHHLGKYSFDELMENLGDKWWRLNNLYYIIDKAGDKVLFQCKATQRRLYNSIWYRLIDLKARQLGGTTFFALYFLDDCLFNSNIQADIIAHRLDDAKKIFRKKIKFAYDSLPKSLRDRRPLTRESADELVFNNGSAISVTVSSRSGTPQRLHVSEFGKICAKFPERAREIMTGAIQAVPKNGIVAIESTAEGNQGAFFDLCKEAQDLIKLGRKPTNLEFKFFFAAWWEEPEYSLPPDQHVPIPNDQTKYLDDTEKKIAAEKGAPFRFTPGQRCWWYSQYKILGDDMYRENPATPEEAFLNRIRGAYFIDEFNRIRSEKRICAVPYNPASLVDTWWDLGMNDVMAIWFTQDVGRELHVIDYLEDSGYGFAYYADRLNEKKYRYGRHYAPHDISVRELGTGESRRKAAARLGIRFERIPRVQDKQDSIQAVRSILPICWFDEVKCDLGIKRLENYRREWDEHLQTYKRSPLHDENSNGADAFQTFAQGHSKHLQAKNSATGIGVAQAPAPTRYAWS
ncbi:MAG: hypothetical protein RBT11_14135 [Desulfobacterales bacterium]|jgi:hypothetical protein|nr:hypothetical protein [Desulfobacterales bacterium]